MIDIILNNLLITFIISFVIGYSGFIDVLKIKLFEFLNGKKTIYKHYSLKPFDCELCLTFWVLVFFNLLTDTPIIFSFVLASLAAFLAPVITKLLNYIYRLINDVLQ